VKKLLPAVALLLLCAPALATERIELANRLRVFLVPQRSAPVVSVTVFMPVGRVHEPDRHAGISHFVEHMMYRATEKRPGGRSEREAWAAGARFRAQTWEDFTRYEVALPAERLDLAFDLLEDALTSAKFLPAEVEEERRIIIEEIAKRRADAELFTWEEADGLAFRPDPYGERIIGTTKTVSSITREDLYAWYRSRYRPDGSVLVVTGHFDRAKTLGAIEGAFGDWRGAGPKPKPAPPPPAAFGHLQEMVIRRDDASPMIAVTAALPPYLDPDYLATRFLRELMAGWMDRRLVSETRAALQTTIWHVPRLRRNLLRIRVRLAKPEDAPRARDALLGLLAEMRDARFPWSGIAEVSKNFEAREVLLREDLSTLATVIGRGALAGYYREDGPPEHLAANDRYDRIAAADIARVARRYLHPANLRVTVLVPEEATVPGIRRASRGGGEPRFTAAAEPVRIPWSEVETLASPGGGTSPRDGDATVTELPGGTKLVYLERNALPVVGVAIVFPAGSRLDPKDREGLAALTLRAVERETEGDSRYRLRWTLFAAGDDRDFRVTRSATRLAFVVPREEFARTLEAVARILERPAFTPSAVNAARGALLARARHAREKVGTFAEQAFRDAVLGDVPARHPVTGTPESIARITVEDLRAFHRRNYRLGDATIAIVGDIAPRSARTAVLNVIADGGAPALHRKPLAEAVRTAHPGRREFRHASGRGYLVSGTLAPAFTHPDRAAAEILRLAIGWQVFETMTDRRSIAYEAGPLYFGIAGPDPLGFYVGVQPDSLTAAREALDGILAEAAKGRLPVDLVAAAKGAWLGAHARSRLRSDEVAIRLALNVALGRAVDSEERLAGLLRRLPEGAPGRLASRLLRPEEMVTVVVSPQGVISK